MSNLTNIGKLIVLFIGLISKKIEEYGLRGLARILKEKLGEKEAPNAGTIRNALTRDKYPPIYRISKLIKNALT